MMLLSKLFILYVLCSLALRRDYYLSIYQHAFYMNIILWSIIFNKQLIAGLLSNLIPLIVDST